MALDLIRQNVFGVGGGGGVRMVAFTAEQFRTASECEWACGADLNCYFGVSFQGLGFEWMTQRSLMGAVGLL
jgi:hypothetical protein